MRIKIIAIGKAGRGPEQSLIDEYIRRLPWQAEVRELELKRPPSDAEQRKSREGELLLEAIPSGAAIIALDERGKNISSRDFAEKIDDFQGRAINTLVFIIGGADGLSAEVRNRADMLLSFGKLTWPHMMVRSMLAEQIYRAWSILAGHPYHRD